MPFEKDWYGNETVLQALLDGWQPEPEYRFQPNKTVYVRALHFAHGWSRDDLVRVMRINHGNLRISLSAPWQGLNDPPPEVEPDWKLAYECALIREKNWRDEVGKLRHRIMAAQEYATSLQESDHRRTRKVQVIGTELKRILR